MAGLGVHASDQSDAPRQHGQAPLELRCEQPFGSQLLLAALQGGQQLTDAHRAHGVGPKDQAPVAHPELALHVQEDPLAGLERWRKGAVQGSGHHDRQRRVDVDVADRQVHLRAAASRDLHDLSLDPHAVQPGDVITGKIDGVGEIALTIGQPE